VSRAVQPVTAVVAVAVGSQMAIYPGGIAAGTQGPVVNSWVSASNASMPHMAAAGQGHGANRAQGLAYANGRVPGHDSCSPFSS
jgi:hypothetical protein